MRAGAVARCVAKPVAFGNPHHSDANTDANNAHPDRDHAGARTDYEPFVDNGDQHRGECGPSRSDFLRGEPGADPHADFQPRRHTDDDTREADDDTREDVVGNTNINANQHHCDGRPIRVSDSDSYGLGRSHAIGYANHLERLRASHAGTHAHPHSNAPTHGDTHAHRHEHQLAQRRQDGAAHRAG